MDDGQDDVSALVARVTEAASAYIRGDMDRYLELIHYVRGFTLMSPIGGPASRYDDRSEVVRASASLFNGGECQLESLEVHAWDNHRRSCGGRAPARRGRRFARARLVAACDAGVPPRS